MNYKSVIGVAALIFGLASSTASAYTAIAYSSSAERGGSSYDAPTKEAAIADAIDQCKKNGGGSDCQVFKVTDEPGFVALFVSCAKTCGVTAVTGRPTAEQARIDGKRECEAHYRASCQLVQEWKEGAPRNATTRNDTTPSQAGNKSSPPPISASNNAQNTAGKAKTNAFIKNYPDPSFGFEDRPASTNKEEEEKVLSTIKEFKNLYESNETVNISYYAPRLLKGIATKYLLGTGGFQKDIDKSVYWHRKIMDIEVPMGYNDGAGLSELARTKSEAAHGLAKSLYMRNKGHDRFGAVELWNILKTSEAYFLLCKAHASNLEYKEDIFLAVEYCKKSIKTTPEKGPHISSEATNSLLKELGLIANSKSGKYYSGQDGHQKSEANGMKYACLASELKTSHFLCATGWYFGDGGKIDKQEARRVALLSIESNDAIELLGSYYLLNREPSWKNDANKLLKMAADMGNPEAKALISQK